MALNLGLATTNVTAATATDCTVTKPASTAEGDLVVVHIHTEDGVTVTEPSGWAQIGSTVSHGSVNMQDRAYQKVMGAGEPASWTWTHASCWRTGSAYRITGAPATSVIDGTPTTNTGTGTTLTWLSITTAQNNSALVGFRGSWDVKTQSTLSSPLVERLDTGWSGIASGVQATAGASGDKTLAIAAAGTDEWNGIFFAVKDAAESPSQDTPELRGRPFGLHGQQQMSQLLAH